jgi:ACS family tartrate transporter-like MFS transporter
MGAVAEREVLARVRWRLLPLLFLLYMVNLIDRSNVGFARLEMLADLQMSERAYGFGAGVFYLGYFLFEVPSNLILARVGARRWISRILVSWGLVTCATMAVRGPVSFALLRVLLGFAEAGFFPGMILYLTYWFPARERARAVALFMIGAPVTGIVNGPLSGAIMQFMGDAVGLFVLFLAPINTLLGGPLAGPLGEFMNGIAGLRGWQWLFLLQGIPAVLLGFVVIYALPDRPADTRWLAPAERDWLTARVGREEEHRVRSHGLTLLEAIVHPRVLLLTLVYFTVAAGSNAVAFFMPKLLEDRFAGFNKFQVGLLAAIPNACAVVGMVFNSWHSDRTGERRWHVAVPAFLAATGWVLFTTTSSRTGALVGLALAQAGVLSTLPVFWSLPTAFLSGAAAAGGIAWINSLGNLGGFFDSYIIGLSKDLTEEFTWGLLATAALLLAGGVMVLFTRHDRSAESAA